MIDLPRTSHRWPKGGEWKPLRSEGTHTASVRCPECDELATLIDHTIAPNGMISPSLQCPTKDCTWHVNARLAGWPD